MASTIKSRIIAAIMQALAGVASPQNRIKAVRPNNDYTAQGRDAIGQTYQFDVHVKIWVPHAPPPTPRADYQHEELAAAVIQALEDPKLLAGLGTLVIGAEEQSFLSS